VFLAESLVERVDAHLVLRGVVNGGCYGSVLLDNELWQSLTAMNGHDVPWVYGCVLDHGHDEDHGAYRRTRRTANRSSGSAGPTPGLRGSNVSKPLRRAATRSRSVRLPTGCHLSRRQPAARQRIDVAGLEGTATGSETAALWAIAAGRCCRVKTLDRTRRTARDRHHGADSSSKPHGSVTLMSGWGGGSVSAMGSSITDELPRPSNSATHACRPSARESGQRRRLGRIARRRWFA